LTADGKVRYCLFAIEETDVRSLLRDGSPDEAIAAAVRQCIGEKWIGHQINSTQFVPPPRPMYSIGG
jgi:cyclic pyranopterin phosphate synthase